MYDGQAESDLYEKAEDPVSGPVLSPVRGSAAGICRSIHGPALRGARDGSGQQPERDASLVSEAHRSRIGAELLFAAGTALILIYLIKNSYLLLLKGAELCFIFNNRLELSGQLMKSYMEKPYTFHLEKNSSEVLQNVTFDVNKLYDLILYGMELLSDLLIIGLLSVFLLLQDPVITLVVIAILGGCSLVWFGSMRGRTEAYGRQNQLYNSRMIQAVNQALGGIKEIKLLAREDYFVQAYEENGRRYARSLKRGQFLQYAPKYLIETICVCGILCVVFLRLSMGVEIRDLVPQLSVFAVAAFRLLPSANAVNRLISNILFLAPSIDRIYEDLQSAGTSPEEKSPAKQEEGFLPAECIRFQDVSFGYPGSGREILHQVNVRIPVGSSVGFVGSSGAGKTTFVDLLLGLLVPDQGHIFYGDQDIREHPGAGGGSWAISRSPSIWQMIRSAGMWRSGSRIR